MIAEKTVRVILVDDETSFTYFLAGRLTRQGFIVTVAGTGEEALHELTEREFDVAVLDMRLPGIDGLELLGQVKGMLPELEVIILTGFGSIDSATEAMKRGAYDYLTKPCSAARLEQMILKAAEKKWLAEQARGLSEALWRQTGNQPIIGQSPGIRLMVDLIRRVADGDAPVLILGESGTGKELVARSLHFWSNRRQRPLQALNIAAIPMQLLESELFGHAKGAFTGAVSVKAGFVEDADGGTLFLDEIGELDPGVQAKLLRFLESGEFRRVGENRTRSVKVRVVAATNRDLYQEVQKGNFRADLYYRLNVVTIRVPPLRERQEDVLLLADYFLKVKAKGQRKELSSRAVQALLDYDMPGNVRELANMIERGVLLAPGTQIEPEHLYSNIYNELGMSSGVTFQEDVVDKKEPDDNPVHTELSGCMGTNNNRESPKQEEHKSNLLEEDYKLSSLESKHIKKVLNVVGGNKTKAAQLLGIGVRTLYRKVEEYHIVPNKSDE